MILFDSHHLRQCTYAIDTLIVASHPRIRRPVSDEESHYSLLHNVEKFLWSPTFAFDSF